MDSYEECLEYLGVLFAKPKTPEDCKIQSMRKWIANIGITVDDIDRLNIIHVTGTKGKGSTCAFTEQILRNRGLKTGLFSSPHVIDVRERIKINGQLISKEMFVKYFNAVYNGLHANMVPRFDNNIPFFSFMNLVAFHTFLNEGVDVAVIEVGMGGLNDSTNIIGRPVVCGVTSIGLDHVAVLGDTVEKIAKNKSGIFKRFVPVFTSPQSNSVLEVLFESAAELGCPIKVAPALDNYPNGPVELGITGKVQQSNASLALQLTRSWLQTVQQRHAQDDSSDHIEQNSVTASPFTIHQSDIQALSQCTLPGRHQIIKKPNETYYLDGAHTEESIMECMEWFNLEAKRESKSKSGKTKKILIFNTSLDRDSAKFLSILKTCCFDGVAFCPNIDTKVPEKLNIYNANIEQRKQQLRHVSHVVSEWEKLVDMEHLPEQEIKGNGVSNGYGNGYGDHVPLYDINAEKPNPHKPIHTSFPCVRHSLCWASQGRIEELRTSSDMPKFMEDVDHAQVLITGSMHLVGAALGVVCPAK